jgi:hypothetical protein
MGLGMDARICTYIRSDISPTESSSIAIVTLLKAGLNADSLEIKMGIRWLLKNIDTEIDSLEDQYDSIQNNRKSKGYSLAIYKCNDIEAIQLIEINNKIDMLESKQDTLRKEYNDVFYKQYAIESLALHENFKENKYEIILDNDYNNKIYTNDKDLYINKAKQANSSIEVREYIKYNNHIKHECNKPYLRTVYSYNSTHDIYYHADIHQLNYGDYKQIWTNSKGNILQLKETGYTNNNEEIYSHGINVFGQEWITLHKPFGSAIYEEITRYKTINDNKYSKYYHDINTLKHFVLNQLTKDIQDIIYNLLDKLRANKSYKYDIDYIRDFIMI